MWYGRRIRWNPLLCDFCGEIGKAGRLCDIKSIPPIVVGASLLVFIGFSCDLG